LSGVLVFALTVLLDGELEKLLGRVFQVSHFAAGEIFPLPANLLCFVRVVYAFYSPEKVFFQSPVNSCCIALCGE